VRAGLRREDDYTAPGKRACDWTDRAAREELVDALVRDAYRAHYGLRGERLDPQTAEAAVLLATVTGQDVEETTDGHFRIFEDTAPDRVISTVDPEARHGHKTTAHGFDGYKAHVGHRSRLRGHLRRRGQPGHQRRRLRRADTAE
jgi:hypothetical protein